MQKTLLITAAALIVIVGVGFFIVTRQDNTFPEIMPSISPAAVVTNSPLTASSLPSPPPADTTTAPEPTPPEPAATSVIYPIAEFTSRITKKPFGIHITPGNSPVSPERFSGWHSGTDIEYGDTDDDVPVMAIANGTVIASRTIDGYGGVVIIRHTVNGETITALYGHLDPTSMVTNSTTVTQGQRIGILGDGYTPETDGERKHLHFSISKGSAVNLRGYVQSEAQLSAWHDPAEWIEKLR